MVVEKRQSLDHPGDVKNMLNFAVVSGMKGVGNATFLPLRATTFPLIFCKSATGSESGGATTLLEVHERLTREKLAGREGPNMDELDSSFRLLLLLNSLDLSLLHSSVQQLGK